MNKELNSKEALEAATMAVDRGAAFTDTGDTDTAELQNRLAAAEEELGKCKTAVLNAVKLIKALGINIGDDGRIAAGRPIDAGAKYMGPMQDNGYSGINYLSPETSAMRAELERCERAYAQRRPENDPASAGRYDPSIKSLDESGDEYSRLVKRGPDGETDYIVLKEGQPEGTRKTPPVIGSVNSKTAEERDYFTSAELDSLTDKELENPKIFAKAMKSITMLKAN